MADNGTTWIVVRTGPSGVPVCEYVKGERLVPDSSTGALEILVGEATVRRFPAGSWSNYTEWVSTDSWFGGGVGTPRYSQLTMASAIANPHLEPPPASHPLTAADSAATMGGAVRSPFAGR